MTVPLLVLMKLSPVRTGARRAHKKQACGFPQACKVLQQFCHIQRQMDDPVFDHDVFGVENICIANNG